MYSSFNKIHGHKAALSYTEQTRGDHDERIPESTLKRNQTQNRNLLYRYKRESWV